MHEAHREAADGEQRAARGGHEHAVRSHDAALELLDLGLIHGLEGTVKLGCDVRENLLDLHQRSSPFMSMTAWRMSGAL